MAKLYFRYGAMNSGKSTALLQAAYNYEERDQRVLLAKPAIDSRGDNAIVSRLGASRAVDFTIAPDEDILALFMRQRAALIRATDRDVSCFLVDEAQFLSEGQVDDLLRIAIEEDVPVLAYGIRTDFVGNLFEGSQHLLAWADTISEIKTICHCGRKATMHLRVGPDGRALHEGAQIEIGGNERYLSVCRRHFKTGLGDEAARGG